MSDLSVDSKDLPRILGDGLRMLGCPDVLRMLEYHPASVAPSVVDELYVSLEPDAYQTDPL
jgi:hypothetical protein